MLVTDTNKVFGDKVKSGQVRGHRAFQKEGRAPAGNLKQESAECVRRQRSPEGHLCSPRGVSPDTACLPYGRLLGGHLGADASSALAPFLAQFCLGTVTSVSLRIWGTAPSGSHGRTSRVEGVHRWAQGGQTGHTGIERQEGRPAPGRPPTPGQTTRSVLGVRGPSHVSERCSQKADSRAGTPGCRGLCLTLGGREGWQG